MKLYTSGVIRPGEILTRDGDTVRAANPADRSVRPFAMATSSIPNGTEVEWIAGDHRGYIGYDVVMIELQRANYLP